MTVTSNVDIVSVRRSPSLKFKMVSSSKGYIPAVTGARLGDRSDVTSTSMNPIDIIAARNLRK